MCVLLILTSSHSKNFQCFSLSFFSAFRFYFIQDDDLQNDELNKFAPFINDSNRNPFSMFDCPCWVWTVVWHNRLKQNVILLSIYEYQLSPLCLFSSRPTRNCIKFPLKKRIKKKLYIRTVRASIPSESKTIIKKIKFHLESKLNKVNDLTILQMQNKRKHMRTEK